MNGGCAKRKNPGFRTVAWNITSSVAVGQNACTEGVVAQVLQIVIAQLVERLVKNLQKNKQAVSKICPKGT